MTALLLLKALRKRRNIGIIPTKANVLIHTRSERNATEDERDGSDSVVVLGYDDTVFLPAEKSHERKTISKCKIKQFKHVISRSRTQVKRLIMEHTVILELSAF